jgi:hypothetical protein
MACVMLGALGARLFDEAAARAFGQLMAAEPSTQHELNELLSARYQTASNLLQMEENRLRQGVTTLGRACEVARWTRDSAVELPTSANERLQALTNYLSLTRRLEESISRAVDSGMATPADRESARYLRLDAEVALLRSRLH